MNQSKGISGFADGASCFASGVKFFQEHPRLLPVAIIPFCLTIGVFLTIGIVGYLYFADWRESFFANKDAWYWTWTGAEFLLSVLFFLIYGVVSLFTFVIVGSLITSPFSEYLSQQVERELLPNGPTAAAGRFSMARDVARGLKHEVIRLTIYIAIWCCSLVLLLIPILGQIGFTICMGYVSIRYLAWDGLDYCMARQRMGFREKMAFLRESRARTVGYGAISFLLLTIPFTTLFVLPLNAVGGSILYCRIRSGQ